MARACSVPNGAALLPVLWHVIRNENERFDPKAADRCSLSYVWSRSWEAMFVAFRCPALRTTRRPEAFRGRGD